MIPRKLKEEIEAWIRDGRYGHLQINFSGGKIVNVNRVESIKVEFIGNVGSVSASIITNVPNDTKLEE